MLNALVWCWGDLKTFYDQRTVLQWLGTVGLSNSLCLLFVTGGGMTRVVARCGALA